MREREGTRDSGEGEGVYFSMSANHTRLIVRDMRVEMPIGIFEKDRTELCPLLINLIADVCLPDDWQADDYDQVLGYDKIIFMIREVTGAGHLNLLETLAETLAERCFAWQQVQAVTVRIEKPAIFGDCIPGVEIARKRAG